MAQSGPATDARGFTRPNDGNGDGIASFDIGAAEGEEVPSLVVDNISDIDDGDTTPGNLTLREAVRLSIEPREHRQSLLVAYSRIRPHTNHALRDGTGINRQRHDHGAGRAPLLTIDANNLSRIFDITVIPTVTLSQMTLTGGLASDENGGAIRSAGTLTVVDSVVTGNTATSNSSTGYGGGIDSNGSLTIVRSTI